MHPRGQDEGRVLAGAENHLTRLRVHIGVKLGFSLDYGAMPRYFDEIA